MSDAEITERIMREVLPRYIDTAKNYAQLSIGALALSVTFKEKVLGSARTRPGWLLLASWFCFLLSIAASAWYQYVAVKLIELRMLEAAYESTSPDRLAPAFPLSISALWPGNWYAVMVSSFFLGAVALVATSGREMTPPLARAPIPNPEKP